MKHDVLRSKTVRIRKNPSLSLIYPVYPVRPVCGPDPVILYLSLLISSTTPPAASNPLSFRFPLSDILCPRT